VQRRLLLLGREYTVGIVAVGTDGGHNQSGMLERMTVDTPFVLVHLFQMATAAQSDLLVQVDGRSSMVNRQDPVPLLIVAVGALLWGFSGRSRLFGVCAVAQSVGFRLMTFGADLRYVFEVFREGNSFRLAVRFRGMCFRYVEAAGIAAMAVVAVDSLQEMDVFGQAFFRDKQPPFVLVPQVGFAVAREARVFVLRQLRAGWRLTDRSSGGCQEQGKRDGEEDSHSSVFAFSGRGTFGSSIFSSRQSAESRSTSARISEFA